MMAGLQNARIPNCLRGSPGGLLVRRPKDEDASFGPGDLLSSPGTDPSQLDYREALSPPSAEREDRH